MSTPSTGDSLTLGMHEMTRRLAATETATGKPPRKKYPLSRSGMLKLFKNLASPGKQREAPASPQAAEELKIGKLDTQHPCKIKVGDIEATYFLCRASPHREITDDRAWALFWSDSSAA
jgi:hypothetical protein